MLLPLCVLGLIIKYLTLLSSSIDDKTNTIYIISHYLIKEIPAQIERFSLLVSVFMMSVIKDIYFICNIYFCIRLALKMHCYNQSFGET